MTITLGLFMATMLIMQQQSCGNTTGDQQQLPCSPQVVASCQVVALLAFLGAWGAYPWGEDLQGQVQGQQQQAMRDATL